MGLPLFKGKQVAIGGNLVSFKEGDRLYLAKNVDQTDVPPGYTSYIVYAQSVLPAAAKVLAKGLLYSVPLTLNMKDDEVTAGEAVTKELYQSLHSVQQNILADAAVRLFMELQTHEENEEVVGMTEVPGGSAMNGGGGNPIRKALGRLLPQSRPQEEEQGSQSQAMEKKRSRQDASEATEEEEGETAGAQGVRRRKTEPLLSYLRVDPELFKKVPQGEEPAKMPPGLVQFW